jgi:hypothetical protein
MVTRPSLRDPWDQMRSAYLPDGQPARRPARLVLEKKTRLGVFLKRPDKYIPSKKTLSTVLLALNNMKSEGIFIETLFDIGPRQCHDMIDSLDELISDFSILVERLESDYFTELLKTKEEKAKFSKEFGRKTAVYAYFELTQGKAYDFLVALETLKPVIDTLMNAIEKEACQIEDVLNRIEKHLEALYLLTSKSDVSYFLIEEWLKENQELLGEKSFDTLGVLFYDIFFLTYSLIPLMYELQWKGTDLVASFDKMAIEISGLAYSVDTNLIIQAPDLQLAVSKAFRRTREKAKVVLDFADQLEKFTFTLIDDVEDETLEIEDIIRDPIAQRVEVPLIGIASTITLLTYNLTLAKPISACVVVLSYWSWYDWKVKDLKIEKARGEQGKSLRPDGLHILQRKTDKIKYIFIKIKELFARLRT